MNTFFHFLLNRGFEQFITNITYIFSKCMKIFKMLHAKIRINLQNYRCPYNHEKGEQVKENARLARLSINIC